MRRHPDPGLIGQQFGGLTVVGYSDVLTYNGNRQHRYICHCECGNYTTVFLSNLRSKKYLTRSCGCIGREQSAVFCQEVIGPKSKHGQSRRMKTTEEYRIWAGMRNRCSNARDPNYHLYGARGIRVCARWDDFSAFLEDMGPRPSKEHSLDRKDNAQGYSKENCRWATGTEQSNNRRSNFRIEYRGHTKTLAEWSREIGIKSGTLRQRLFAGWSIEKALTTPLSQRNNHGVLA